MEIARGNLQRLIKIVASFLSPALMQPEQTQIETRPEQARIGVQNPQVKGFGLFQLSPLVEGDGLLGHGFQIQNFHVLLSFRVRRISLPEPQPGPRPARSC